MDSAKVSKKDVFGNPIKETSREQEQRFEYLSAKLSKASELSKQEQQDLLDDIAVMITEQQ